MSLEANKELVRAFAEAGNRNDLEAFDRLLAPNFVRHCEATPEVSVTDPEGFKEFYRETAKTFPDQRMVSQIGGMFRIENGQIAELWVTWDNLAGLMQLGLLPGPGG